MPWTLMILMAIFGAASGVPDSRITVGPGSGISGPRLEDPPCDGDLVLSYDGTAENAYAWQFDGIQPPDYGTFAEGYEWSGAVCGMELHLTTLPGYYNDQVMDLYVYDSDGENPDAVLSVIPGVGINPPALWPDVSVHEVTLPQTSVEGLFFLGFWGAWPGQITGWFIAADLNGAEGRPKAKIAPGVGYPTGWHDVDVVFGPTRSIGIGAWVTSTPVAVHETRWGTLKHRWR